MLSKFLPVQNLCALSRFSQNLQFQNPTPKIYFVNIIQYNNNVIPKSNLFYQYVDFINSEDF